jgi:nucleoside-diphosphate kinase
MFVIKPYFSHKPVQQTLAIIKPDAVAAKVTGKIIEKIEQAGFKIVDLRKIQLEKEGAEKFYAEHKTKTFFADLVSFMTSGPVIVMILEKEEAVNGWRELMGTTDPAKANEGTIRKLFGTSIEKNAVHGSDSLESAPREIKFFFSDAAPQA